VVKATSVDYEGNFEEAIIVLNVNIRNAKTYTPNVKVGNDTMNLILVILILLIVVVLIFMIGCVIKKQRKKETTHVYNCNNEKIMQQTEISESNQLSPISSYKTETFQRNKENINDEDMMSQKLMTSQENEYTSNLYTNIHPPMNFTSQNTNPLSRNPCLNFSGCNDLLMKSPNPYNGHIYRPIPSCPPMKFEETQKSIITSQCTEDCNIYGHSDNCWLPGNKSANELQRNTIHLQHLPEESISSSEPKTLPYDESRPQAYKPANFYYDPHFNYDVTNSTSIGRLSNPSEVSFPQSSKSSGSFSQQNYLSLALKSKLSSYEDNRISPKINT